MVWDIYSIYVCEYVGPQSTTNSRIFAFRRIRTPMRTLALRKFPMLKIDANISNRAPSVRFVALRWFGWGHFLLKQIYF